ncbi:MAG: hypothetical protein Q8P32_05145 [Candidatus Komeilibacteria bacterium]|nr:hypothetical protein [Candidatus Komeilibacteria bacterium]
MKKEATKIYRAKLDSRHLTKVVGWPRATHSREQKRTWWQSIRAMLF